MQYIAIIYILMQFTEFQIDAAIHLGVVHENFGSHVAVQYVSAHDQYVKAGNLDLKNSAPRERLSDLYYRIGKYVHMLLPTTVV